MVRNLIVEIELARTSGKQDAAPPPGQPALMAYTIAVTDQKHPDHQLAGSTEGRPMSL
jgi:hypothetical protein